MNGTATLKRVSAVSAVCAFTIALTGCSNSMLSDNAAPRNAAANSSEQEIEEQSIASLADSTRTDSDLMESDLMESDPIRAQGPGMGAQSSETLMSDEDGLGIELVTGSSSNQILISTGGVETDYTVTTLESPTRVVIDLHDLKTRVNREIETADSRYISRIRVGAHPDKSRIVLDLAGDGEVVHDVNTDQGRLVVSLTGTASAAVTSADATSADETSIMSESTVAADGISDSSEVAMDAGRTIANESMSGEDDISDEDYLASLEGADENEMTGEEAIDVAFDHQGTDSTESANASDMREEQLETAQMDESMQVASNELSTASTTGESMNTTGESMKPRVTGLSLEANSTGNMLIADVTSAGFFTLKRTAPSEYVLRLEDATFETGAARTLLAPQGAGAIRSVRPTIDGEDALLRIFVETEADLRATPRNGRIVVAAATLPYGADARAQADLEAAEIAEGDEAANQALEVEGGNAELAANAPVEGNGFGQNDELSALLGDAPKYTGRLISLDLQDTDIDNALRIIAEVSNLNIIASDDVAGKVTLRLIDVPWDQALDVILKTNGLDKVQEGNVVRIAPVEKLREERESLKQAQQAEEELEPLQVAYRRISYAKAAELKPLIETVLTERGTVTYDERTNQVIIRDIRRGVKNSVELIKKLDLRTPQVLLETQIVEAQRSLLRDLGSELGFSLIQSPATGNATGYNFPNSISVSGSGLADGSDVFSSFPSAAGAGVSLLFDSADGAKSLSARISGLETEGRIRVVSRPAVVTTNNKQAIIKSVEKIRVKTPSGGLSVATGQGASASGSAAVATETIEIGITLEVVPQASPDYFVLLDIRAKSSNFGTREVEGIPSEIERSATSSVLVSSGQTFAMGGIYKIQDRDSVDGVPFFKDIPAIGHLFRGTTIDNSDEELLFFITPRIVEGSFDDAVMEVVS